MQTYRFAVLLIRYKFPSDVFPGFIEFSSSPVSIGAQFPNGYSFTARRREKKENKKKKKNLFDRIVFIELITRRWTQGANRLLSEELFRSEVGIYMYIS